MDMDFIWRMFDELQDKVTTSYSAASSSQSAPPDPHLFRALTKINDHVYEVHKPAGRPSVEIVVFHGLQLSYSNFDVRCNTWISRGEPPELWLNWLGEKDYVPGARILAVSYDASLKRTHQQGISDMYVTCENLIYSLTKGNSPVGQDGCPVVLVGHCLGGLVMKELCLRANKMLSLERNESVENFLLNVKGFFTYASPHHGSRLADCNIESNKGLLFQGLKTLDTDAARRNEEFRKLRRKYEWKAFGVGEAFPVTLGSLRFTGIVVEEASARHDVDIFHTISGDHFTVCRPLSRTCNSFRLLSSFVSEVMEKDKEGLSTNTRLLDELKIVGHEGSIGYVLNKLGSNRRLGLVGMGGIGKTTLAKAMYDKISGEFDYTCFLDEVKTKMEAEETPDALRTKITERLKRKGRDVKCSWSKLKGKKVLIILDDAEYKSQVLVMTKEDDFAEESCVIVTSRRADFLRKQGFETHKVELLSPHESRRLFCLHAFGQSGAPPNYEDRVMRIVEKCGRLPLALKVSGSYLSMQKTKHAVDEECDRESLWDEALDKLSNAESLDGRSKDPLWSILMVSYYDLAPSEREMFLDAATCFYQVEVTKVQQAWAACSWGSPRTGWKNLLDRSLVSNGDDGRISMHELLRDLGRKEAGRSRVFDVQDFTQLNDEEKAKVKVLILDGRRKTLEDGASKYKRIGRWFSGFKELQILWLDAVDMRIGRLQRSPRFKFGEFQALRQVVLENCSPDSAPFFSGVQLQALKYLEIDEYRYAYDRPESSFLLMAGWNPFKKLPEFVGQLMELQHLKLSGPLKTLPSTIGKLRALHTLEIRSIYNLQMLPESIGQLTALQHLKLSQCDFKTLPSAIGELRALHTLEIERLTLQMLPESIGQLTTLRCLNIVGCDLLTLPTSVGKLWALERLTIHLCLSLGKLPESVGDLHGLRHLDIWRCESFLKLPSTVSQLGGLEHLEIDVCEGRGALRVDKSRFRFDQLKALRHLKTCACKTLLSTLWQLPALEHLEIYLAPISNCWKFRPVPDHLQELPEDVGQLRELRHLELDGLPFKSLPVSLGALHKLENLIIRNMHSLETFPDVCVQLPALRHLKFYKCSSLKAPSFFSGQPPPALEKLTIIFCGLMQLPKWGPLSRVVLECYG